MTATPACRTRPGRCGHVPVVPLTLLWGMLCPSVLWRNAAEAKHPPTHSQAGESGERSPRHAQPVRVELPEAKTEDSCRTHLAFAQGFGRFVIRYTRPATALGNFEQGSIQTESALAFWQAS